MQNLKIFPTSISQISYKNQQSQIHSNIQYRNPLGDYQIKINGQQNFLNHQNIKNNLNRNENYINANYQYINNLPNEEFVPKPDRIQYKDKVTGYQTMKDYLNQEQLLRAFRIIDITRDDVITEEDLTFVLDYIKQDYTKEQVRQMITMVSAEKDKKYVSFEDFKKIGKGQILPLASYKIPLSNTKNKAQILANLRSSDLFSEQPQKVLQDIESGLISHQKFKGIKKNTDDSDFMKTRVVEDQQQKLRRVLPILSSKAYKARKSKFTQYVTLTNKQFLKRYQEYLIKSNTTNSFTCEQIADILQISISEAEALYPSPASTNTQIQSSVGSTLLVIMQAISFSRLKPINKIEMSLSVISNTQTVTFQQIDHILQFLKGQDSQVSKKLKALYNNYDYNFSQDINKLDILEMLAGYLNIFMIQ